MMMTWIGGQQVDLCSEAEASAVPLWGLRRLMGMAICGRHGGWLCEESCSGNWQNSIWVKQFSFFLNECKLVQKLKCPVVSYFSVAGAGASNDTIQTWLLSQVCFFLFSGILSSHGDTRFVTAVKSTPGNSLAVQWLRLSAPNAGGPSFNPWSGLQMIWSHATVHASTKDPMCCK